ADQMLEMNDTTYIPSVSDDTNDDCATKNETGFSAVAIKFGEIVMKIFMKSLDVIDEDTKNDRGQLVKKAKLLFEINDTGVGICSKFMQGIWESFSKIDTSVIGQHNGASLGLSISKQLVEINKGEIGAESRLGRGSKFWFTWNIELLPISAISKFVNDSSSILSSNEAISNILPLHLRLKRILLIHPVESARIAITNFLKNFEKVGVFDTCDKGIHAAKHYKELYNHAAYDIAFINLCEKNAEEVTKTVLELRKVHDDNLLIVFMIFLNTSEKALATKLIKKVGGKTTSISKPITYIKLINQCSCNNNLEKDVEENVYKNFENSISYNAKSIMNNNSEKFKFDFESSLKINLASSVTSPLNISKKRMSSYEIGNTGKATKCRLITYNKKRILCVDANPVDLKVEELGYSTLLATNGQEAINILQSEFKLLSINNSKYVSEKDKMKSFDISLVLMDCIMPETSGFDTSRAIRSLNSQISNIPIVALTASKTEETYNKCIESGMNDCLVKPIEAEHFIKIATDLSINDTV
ncbi:916_t:CDS:2, partial [Racocetra persica]